MNQSTLRVLSPEVRASDCYDWITAEDVVRHALAAYYVACRLCDPAKYASADEVSRGDVAPWRDGVQACTRGGFAENLTDHFLDRVNRHAHEIGLEGWAGLAGAASRMEAVYPPTPEQLPGAEQATYCVRGYVVQDTESGGFLAPDGEGGVIIVRMLSDAVPFEWEETAREAALEHLDVPGVVVPVWTAMSGVSGS